MLLTSSLGEEKLDSSGKHIFLQMKFSKRINFWIIIFHTSTFDFS